MIKRMSKVIIVLVMALITLAAFSCSKEKQEKKEKPGGHDKMLEQFQTSMEELKNVVVARVNGATITKYDLFTRANKLTSNYEKSGQQMTPEIEQTVQKEALAELVFRELAIQEAIRRNMNVPQQNIDAVLKQYKAKIGSQKDYEEHLKKRNLTEASLIKLIEKDQLFRIISAKEIYEKVKEEGAERELAVEKRKRAWEQELKKNAKIEILLTKVEKKPVDEAQKQTQVAK